ncbi:head maturation protease [Mycobacterium phage Grizzly]|uniref:Minor capsid protein n=1 Tax=Mycobacterium phage Grizzly TaxID=2315539 RepID=A0A386KEF8_9CAUD|nr:head maturation protease [Mycobacterium phage Grizzly]AYD83968.1 minor capsid protein [Mycobacterium phage Grizzly]WDE67650.1 minor capsid protein [Mycobacterium phage RitVan]
MSIGVPEFRGALLELGSGLDSDVRKMSTALARLDDGDALRYVSDAYPEIVTPYLAAAGDLTATWYEDQPAALGAKPFIAQPAELPAVEQLAANGRWAITQQSPTSALEGTSRRQLFKTHRETVLTNADREGVRWAREARPGACGFCRMLATRILTEGELGAPGLYRSKRSARRNPHRFNSVRGHDFCRCVAVPIRGGSDYVVPDYVHSWLEDYEAVSRDADGYLHPPGKIAALMEDRAKARGELFGVDTESSLIRRPRRRRGPEVVDLDAPARAIEAPAGAVRDRVAGAQRFTQRNAIQFENAVQPVADRVAQAQAIAERADEIVSTAARVTGHVKQVTDVADKLLGSQYPAIRSVKVLVDAADKGLRSANQVTGGAVQVARVADRTLQDTVTIAHGVRQVADEVGGLLDETAAIALGARALLTDAGAAARNTAAELRNVRSVDDLAERVTAAVDTADGIQAEGAALVERARATVDATQDFGRAVITELPEALRAPVADMQELAQTVRNLAADVEHAGADAGAVARSVRRLVDALRDYRRAERATETTAAIEARRGPIRVTSERLDLTDATWELPAGEGRLAIEAPERQLALNRKPAPLAIEGPRQPRMLTAAPDRPAIEPPDPHDIAAWLDAEDEHWHAVQYWRRVDDENLHSLPPAERIPDRPAAPEPPAAVTTPPVEIPNDPAPVSSVQAVERAGETELDRAVREFEEALATGDEALIERTAAAMERAEKAELAAAERKAKAAARREAARTADQDRIFELVEAGEDPQLAEAEVLTSNADGRRRIKKVMAEHPTWSEESARRTVHNHILERIRRRDFMAQARADGHEGKGFDDLLDSVFARRVDEIYIEAENATRGHMVKSKYQLTFDPKRLWYVNETTARKYMSEELGNWFDENGRITRPIMRQMILDGSTNFSSYTALVGDFVQ